MIRSFADDDARSRVGIKSDSKTFDDAAKLTMGLLGKVHAMRWFGSKKPRVSHGDINS